MGFSVGMGASLGDVGTGEPLVATAKGFLEQRLCGWTFRFLLQAVGDEGLELTAGLAGRVDKLDAHREGPALLGIQRGQRVV